MMAGSKAGSVSSSIVHIQEYDKDYSRDLLELLPHNLKQKGIL